MSLRFRKQLDKLYTDDPFHSLRAKRALLMAINPRTRREEDMLSELDAIASQNRRIMAGLTATPVSVNRAKHKASKYGF